MWGLRGGVSRQSETEFRYFFSVKKEARLSASELAEMQEGRGEESDEMRVLDAGV